jgi:hypothetical protein
MHDKYRLAAAKITGVLLAAATIAGCACSCPRCAPITCPGWQPNCGVPNPCHGYFSTCWRMWPPQCGPCPSFAVPSVPSTEPVPAAEPLPALPRPAGEPNAPELPAPTSGSSPEPNGFLPSGLNGPEYSTYGAPFLIPTPAGPQTPISLRPARLDNR